MIYQQGPNAPRIPIASDLQRVRFPTRATGSEPLVAVVVTVHDGSSFDPLFREYPQESPEGRVSVWSCGTTSLAPLLERLQREGAAPGEGEAEDPFAALYAELASVDVDSVVFNWECCSECTDAGFRDTALVLRAVEVLLARGHTLMFSDFSLKALLGVWKKRAAAGFLGPCPLVKLGEFGARFELRFDAAALQGCGSAQLERVGDLCEGGQASVQAMGGTVAYTLDAEAARGAPYQVKVLTVVTSFEGQSALERYESALQGGRVCVVGSHRGAAGHARITYPNGGSMLLSCGHWVELVKLDVTAERLVRVAEQTYGQARSQVMAQELADASPAQRAQLLQQYSKDIVVQSSPGKYSKK
ncbi:MAG: hypothetical protein HY909_01255 [Deltaproteobacteria bacterium]|nr:hypothetical protein [Deltaproteobacteria bacterium]